MAFSGAGAVCGALVVAWLGRFRRMGTTALVVQAAFGLLIIGFAMSRVELLSEALLFVGGAAMMIVFSSTNSLVQLIVPNADARPRDEHLHAGVSRRHDARRPGERNGRRAHLGTRVPLCSMARCWCSSQPTSSRDTGRSGNCSEPVGNVLEGAHDDRCAVDSVLSFILFLANPVMAQAPLTVGPVTAQPGTTASGELPCRRGGRHRARQSRSRS